MLGHLFKKKHAVNCATSEYVFTVLSVDQLLKEDIYAKQLKQLKELLSITDDIYTNYYLPPLHQLALLVQKLPAFEKGPYHTKGGFLQFILQRTVAALKYRRSLMLPIGGTPEAQYREHDLWTYAIYTASLLKDCWMLSTAYEVYFHEASGQTRLWSPLAGPMPVSAVYQFKLAPILEETFKPTLNALFAAQLLNHKALCWLTQVPAIFQEWIICISFATNLSATIAKVIDQAQTAIMPSSLQESSFSSISEAVKPNTSVETVNEPLSTEPIPELFLAWLKQLVTTPQAQKDSLWLMTQEGIFIDLSLIKHFINTHLAQFNKLLLSPEEVLEEVKHADFVDRNTECADGLYQYYRGEWKARDILQGLIIKPEFIFPEGNFPLVHPEYQLDLS